MNSLKNNKGFTLIELMIAVAILGIIASIAFPSYMEHVRKAKRTDAKVELLRIAQLQESFFTQKLSYASVLSAGSATVGGLGLATPVMSEQDNYEVTLTATPGGCAGTVASPCLGYTLTATAQASQNDSFCGNFTLTNTGLKRVTAGGAPGSEANKIRSQECWK